MECQKDIVRKMPKRQKKNKKLPTKRQEKILEAVVKEHIKKAQPIGSEYLIKHYHFSFSPATLRNEMLELTEEGFLKQPHASAGRLPTDLAYQFFVDHLVSPANLDWEEEKEIIYKLMKNINNLEEIFLETTNLVSKLTKFKNIWKK